MEFRLLGWADVAFRLDHRAFTYAGKFVVPGGATAAVEPGYRLPDPREAPAEGVLAAVAVSEDRTDASVLWLRYVTVRRDRRGEGIGARLAAFTAERARERGYDRVRIGVNNPYAYEALSKAGFGFTGRETGLAELVLECPSDRSRYREGLERFADRELGDEERAFLERHRERGPPAVLDPEPP
jgi:GNAT superfamily N-acetyltransferase